MSFVLPESSLFNTHPGIRTASEEMLRRRSEQENINSLLRAIRQRFSASDEEHAIFRLPFILRRDEFEFLSRDLLEMGLRAECNHYGNRIGTYQELRLTRLHIGQRPSQLQAIYQPNVADVEAKLGVSSDMWDTLPAHELVNAVFEVIRVQTERRYSVRTPPQSNLCQETTLAERIHNETYYEFTTRLRGI